MIQHAQIFTRFMTVLFFAVLWSCGIKVDLPVASNNSDPVFGAGDTNYIRISPDWDAANGYNFESPWDIIVGADGYLFIADHDQPGIHVVSAAGGEVIDDDFGNDFSDLQDIRDTENNSVYPSALDQDSRLNIFIADSSNRLMVWNQYLNNVGVDSMAIAIQLLSPDNELLWVSNFDSITTLQNDDWEVHSIAWSTDNLEQWLKPRPFWDANDSLESIQVERFFVDPDSIHVTGISSRGDICFVADAHSNAILALTYKPTAMLVTGAGDRILVYSGTITDRFVSSGTGNGTVNDPRGMTHGSDGALYYTQWGENFSVHKVGGNSGFEYGEDDIMQIERYHHASDVSLDPLGNIYIADTGHDRIQQFNTAGVFTFNIGMSEVLIDSSIVDSILVGTEYEVTSRDTSFYVEVADILDGPRSVAVDGVGVVYIADTRNHRIMRYRLSTELDYTTEN